MNTRKKRIIFLSLFLVLSILLSYLYTCEYWLKITEYNIKTDKIKSSLKIAFISDLHRKEFGKNNSFLIEAISQESPDFIAVGGDIVNSWDTEHSVAIKLLEQLVKIAPTYYIWGNHEQAYIHKNTLENDIKSTGATILDNSMIKFTNDDMDGEEITIGALTDYPYYEYYEPDYNTEEGRFLKAFIQQEKDNYSILLAHQPEFYFWKLSEMELDLMICGHTHGGVIQIPFTGGLYAPNQGFFPEYDKGFFSSKTANMIVTGGLGNTVPIPRLNNEPEICIININ